MYIVTNYCCYDLG